MSRNIKKITVDVFRHNSILIIALILLMVAVVILSLVPPQILKLIIDRYLIVKESSGLIIMAALYLSVYVFIGFFDFLKNYALTHFGQLLVKEIRGEMEAKLTRLKPSYFTLNDSGGIASRFINDVDNVNSLFTDGVISMTIDCCKIIGIIISIWLFNYKLGLFTLCFVPIIGLITSMFRKRILISQRRNLKEIGKVNNHISETIHNIEMIKSFNRENYMEEKYTTYLSDNFRTNKKVNFFDSCYSPIIQVLTAISVAIILYLSVGESNLLGISIGMTAASVNYVTNLFAPIDSLGMEIQSIQKGISGIQKIDEFLREPEDKLRDRYLDEENAVSGIGFRFENLSFEYEDGKKIIDNFNLTVKPGENVAFIGRTGAGKSTLFKLVVGILEPIKGAVYINEVEAHRLSNNQKRRIFGYVQQDFTFLDGDIWTQINLGDENISREMILGAMEFVGLREYVESFEKGFDTKVNDGLFSQGQKQLLSIARAIVTNPPVLLLDEVTSDLDAVTEQRVVSVLKRAVSGKTILSIAHRQSTIDAADRIIELKEGNLNEL